MSPSATPDLRLVIEHKRGYFVCGWRHSGGQYNKLPFTGESLMQAVAVMTGIQHTFWETWQRQHPPLFLDCPHWIFDQSLRERYEKGQRVVKKYGAISLIVENGQAFIMPGLADSSPAIVISGGVIEFETLPEILAFGTGASSEERSFGGFIILPSPDLFGANWQSVCTGAHFTTDLPQTKPQ